MKEAHSKAQGRVLAAFRTFVKENGRSPTYRELQVAAQISKTAAFNHIKNLVARGILQELPQKRGGVYESPNSSSTINIYLDQRGVLVKVDSPPHIQVMIRRTS